MKKSIVVIGLGVFGKTLATTLARNKIEVIAIDHDPEQVKEVATEVIMAVEMDALNETALKEIGIDEINIAVVCMAKNIESSILAVTLLKKLRVEKIYAKAENLLHEEVLNSLGVAGVIHPERDMAVTFAERLIKPELLGFLELSPHHRIAEMKVPQGFIGQSIEQLKVRKKYGLSIVAIKRGGTGQDNWIVNPGAGEVLRQEDLLVMLGTDQEIEEIRKL